jgi:hypothetical protein
MITFANHRSQQDGLSRRRASGIVRCVADTRECPLCGGTMRLKRSETAVQIPGNPRPTPRIDAEWVCPDCDYFEEVDEDRS